MSDYNTDRDHNTTQPIGIHDIGLHHNTPYHNTTTSLTQLLLYPTQRTSRNSNVEHHTTTHDKVATFIYIFEIYGKLAH